MSEIEPTYTEPARIVFGKDGSIADVPENRILLRQIAEARQLSPANLFKLGTFFLRYPSTRPIGQHLDLFAAIRYIVSLRRADISLRTKAANEDLDWADGWNESGTDEGSETPFEVRLAQIKWVLHSDVGLLVEAVKVDDTDKLAYHVVGISPDPATLPAD